VLEDERQNRAVRKTKDKHERKDRQHLNLSGADGNEEKDHVSRKKGKEGEKGYAEVLKKPRKNFMGAGYGGLRAAETCARGTGPVKANTISRGIL